MTKKQNRRLEEDIQYLNLEEMRVFCKAHDLPIYIHLERPDGGLRKTGDRDRKDVVLKRILDLALRGRRTGPTVYAMEVIAAGPLDKRLTARTRLRYGQYEKKNENFVATMKALTDGAFRCGMIARLVLRDFWTAGKAPTMRLFADEWLRATEAHTRPRPEGAYLSDLWRGEAGPSWKSVRIEIAGRAIEALDRLLPLPD